MRFFRVMGLCVFGLLLASPALGQDGASRASRAHARLDALRDKIASVRHTIAADKRNKSDLANKLAAAEAAIGTAHKRLRELDADIADTQQRIVRLTRRRDAERADLGAQLDALRKQVRAVYANGHINKMRLLLSGQAPKRLGRMLVYYEYFSHAQSRQVRELRAALEQLVARQSALKRQRATLADHRRARTHTLAELEADQKDRRQAIAALDKKLSAHKSSLAGMQQSKQRLKKLLQTLRRQTADVTPPPTDTDVAFGRLKGRMRPPVAGPVLARYGSKKAGGPLRWQGEWLAAALGTPVRAVAAGRVVYVGYMHRYGLIVVLDHGHGYYTLYGHAKASDVAVGDHVDRGQPVAAAGRSGGHRRSGAYFEIRKGDTPIDPARWLSG